MANDDLKKPGDTTPDPTTQTFKLIPVDGSDRGGEPTKVAEPVKQEDPAPTITLPSGETVDKEQFEFEQSAAGADFERDFQTKGSTLAVEAFKRFEHEETETQLSEHYIYSDGEFSEHGHF